MTDLRKTLTKGRKNGRMSRKEHEALDTILPIVNINPESVLDKTDVFGREAPLYLEIGFGAGAFLFQKAAAFPGCDFIGVEIYVPGIAKLLSRLVSKDDPHALSITNLRVVNDDAIYVLTNNIPHNSLDGVYILFPDPWPKKRHQKRRLINPGFARVLVSRLKARGFAIVATDSREYAAEIENSFASAGFGTESEGFHDISKTAYALRAFKENRPLRIYRFVKWDSSTTQ